jgi:hypothetical protein
MLQVAIKAFSVSVVFLLIGLGLTFFGSDSASASPLAINDKATRQLFQAVYANDLASARTSVSNGADVNARDRWGMTPADIAIDRGNYGIAHYLVSIRNTRRQQEAASAPTTSGTRSAAAATAASTAPSKQLKPRTTPAPAPLAAATPASAPSVPVVVREFAGPNPFDPSTPAPGSQLPALSSASQ